MKNLFICATNTNIGKTYTTTKLIRSLSLLGFKVGVFKPVETDVNPVAKDASILLENCQKYNKNFKKFTPEDIAPIRFSMASSVYVAKGNKIVNLNKIKRSYEKVKKECDFLLIESAGGLFSPIEIDFFTIDFINFFNAYTLLISGNELGSINDTLLSMHALESRDIKYSWIINNFKKRDEFEKITLPFYKDYFQTTLLLDRDLDTLVNELVTNCNINGYL